MSRFRCLVLAGWSAGLLIAPLAARAAGPPVITDEVKASMKERVRRGDNASIVVGMVNRSGMTHYGYGEMIRGSGKKVGSSTIYEIGSMSEVFTARLLADSVERGELKLGDPIRKHLPETVRVPAHGKGEITLEHLANHRSGLPRLPAGFDSNHPDSTEDPLYAFLASCELDQDPGPGYEYSDLGTQLLERILARKAKQTYDELLDGRFTAPLGMNDTRFTLTESQRERLATGHEGPRLVSTGDAGATAGARTIRSTVRDMLVFLSASLGTPSLLGWQVETGFDTEILWRSGQTSGFRGFCALLPRAETAVVVLSNSATDVDDLGLHLLEPRHPLKAVTTQK